MDFTRSVENVELHESRAWTHAVLRASEASCENKWKEKPATTKCCVVNEKLRRVRANHSEAFEALHIVDTIAS